MKWIISEHRINHIQDIMEEIHRVNQIVKRTKRKQHLNPSLLRRRNIDGLHKKIFNTKMQIKNH